MARANTKIGDIFSVKIDDNSKKYLQLIAIDTAQLNSDVIRVFSKIYPSNFKGDPEEIIKGDIEFYAHCVTKIGLKMGFWDNVGNSPEVGSTSGILFRNTNDYGSRPGEQVKVSTNWYVWKVNDKEFTKVGRLHGEYRKAEIGIVISPDSIVHRIKTGRYDFVYPDFE